jgi:hypothetical protein
MLDILKRYKFFCSPTSFFNTIEKSASEPIIDNDSHKSITLGFSNSHMVINKWDQMRFDSNVLINKPPYGDDDLVHAYLTLLEHWHHVKTQKSPDELLTIEYRRSSPTTHIFLSSIDTISCNFPL